MQKLLLSYLLIIFTSGCVSPKKGMELPGLSVMQGGTGSSKTQIVVLHKKRKPLVFKIINTSSNKEVRTFTKKETTRSHSSWQLTRINLTKLNPLSRYRIDFYEKSQKIIDSREFKTIESSLKLKWAVASCMNDSFMNAQKQQWMDLVTHRPQMIFMIGDNVYVDTKTKNVTPKVLWDRYVETRNRLEIFRNKKLIPVFATWDDHDYGKNNGGKEFTHKNEAKVIFEEFFPQNINKYVVSQGPGVARAIAIAKQSFLFLDDRSFRSNEEKIEAHFGTEQEKWLYNFVKNAKGPVWLIGGDQFFGGYHKFESYQGNHSKAFSQFIRKLKKIGKRVIFISGDRHLTEIMRIPRKYLGYVTYELTSSGIHSSVFPGSFKRNPNPLNIEAVDGTMNYMIIESKSKGPGVHFTSTSYGPDKKVLFERKLSVQ